MIRRPPRSTRTDTLFPYTTLFRSNPALDTLDRDALQTEIERGLGERIDRPGCFPLAKDANRRCNGKLRPARGRGGDRAGEAGVDEGLVGAEQTAEPLARRVDRVRYPATTLPENACSRREDGQRFGCRDGKRAVKGKRVAVTGVPGG